MSFRRSVNNFVFHSVKHAGFLAKESVFVRILLHFFIQKKSAAETQRILDKTYGDLNGRKRHVEIGSDVSNAAKVGEHSRRRPLKPPFQ